MKFVRAPAWHYFPQPDRPTPPLRALIDGMAAIAPWLETTWWAGHPNRDTKQITAKLEPFPTPTGNAMDELGLRPGWNLETREHYPKMPFL